MKKQTILVPVDMMDRQPVNTWRGTVWTRRQDGTTAETRGTYLGLSWILDNQWELEFVTHWLEPKHDQYILSEQELFDIMKRVWNGAIEYRSLVEEVKGDVSKIPQVTMAQFLKSDTKPDKT